MADLNGRVNDAKDKVEGKTKETVGKVTDDKGKEAEGKLQSGFADAKTKARDAGDDIKEGAEKFGDKIKEGFEDIKEKFHKHDDK
ncbi:CsbD family protein [Enterococcus sp. LJL128]|uniref:CsbD family protein n=1 Tax=Enterococcus sp. LJL51 TaxID=3416656 RepID=UPI003CE987E9